MTEAKHIEKPRILLFAPSLSATGGVERVISGLSALLREKYEVTQCSLDPSGSRPRYENGVRFVPLAGWPKLPFPFRLINYVERAVRLRQFKRKAAIDITISNLWGADLVSMVSGGQDRKIALAHINVGGNPTNRMMMRWLPFVACLYRRFDRVVSVSEPLSREMTQLYELERGKSQCIHNFVCLLESTSADKDRRIGSRVLWCGRLVPEKNPEAAIRIIAEVRKARAGVQLVMLGDGPLAGRVRQVCREHGLSVGSELTDTASAVILPGFVNDVTPHMGLADIQMLTSTDEGLPMTLIEGMAAGLPAVGSDCRSGGIRDALGGSAANHPDRRDVEPTSCGVLLPMPIDDLTVQLWSRWVLRLLDDPDLRQALAAGSRLRSRMFSQDTARSNWFTLIDELLAA